MLNVDIGMLVTCHYDIIHHSFSVADCAIVDCMRLCLSQMFAPLEDAVAQRHRALAARANHGYSAPEGCGRGDYDILKAHYIRGLGLSMRSFCPGRMTVDERRFHFIISLTVQRLRLAISPRLSPLRTV